MENHYTTPEVDVVLLSNDDVITSSKTGTLEDILGEDDPDGGWGGFQ